MLPVRTMKDRMAQAAGLDLNTASMPRSSIRPARIWVWGGIMRRETVDSEGGRSAERGWLGRWARQWDGTRLRDWTKILGQATPATAHASKAETMRAVPHLVAQVGGGGHVRAVGGAHDQHILREAGQ